jgi:hypothetical protein
MTLGRIYGEKARRAITGITLLAGFASSVGWPLSAWGLETIGWRNTCFAWGAAHILIGLPLNLIFIPRVERAAATAAAAATPDIPDRPHNGAAGHRVRLRLVGDGRNGRAPAPHTGIDGRDWPPGRGRRRVHWPRSGIGTYRVGQPAEPPSSDRLDPDLLRDAPYWGRDHGAGRRTRCDNLRNLPWHWQRHSYYRTGDPTARDLRSERLRLPTRHSRRASTDRPGRGAVGVQCADRPLRRTGAACLFWPELGGFVRA